MRHFPLSTAQKPLSSIFSTISRAHDVSLSPPLIESAITLASSSETLGDLAFNGQGGRPSPPPPDVTTLTLTMAWPVC